MILNIGTVGTLNDFAVSATGADLRRPDKEIKAVTYEYKNLSLPSGLPWQQR